MRTEFLLGLALVAATCLAAPAAAQAPRVLLPAAPGDLVAPAPVRAKSLPVLPDVTIERAPVHFAWALDVGTPLEASQPFQDESRAFYTELDAKALVEGFAIEATAPGPLLRISPLGGAKGALGTADIELLRDGKALGASALLHAADAAQLKAAGADFSAGTVAFRVDPALGAGRFSVRARTASGRYLLHVHEPASPYVATLQAGSDTAFAGGSMTARLSMLRQGEQLQLARVHGALSAPDGRVFDVAFEADARGVATARFDLPAEVSSMPGLWELHGFAAAADGSTTVLRDSKTSFAVVVPGARLKGQATASHGQDGLRIGVPLEVGAPGRYELRAVLYGTGPDGSMKPFATAHAANWLEGDGRLELQFGSELLDGAGLAPPYELRQLSLIDQSRLSKLESRAHALRIEAPIATLRGNTAPR